MYGFHSHGMGTTFRVTPSENTDREICRDIQTAILSCLVSIAVVVVESNFKNGS